MLSGILGVVLLRHTPWGVNVIVWMVATAGIAWSLSRRLNRGRVLFGWKALLPVLFFAGAFAWRDSDELKIANGTLLFLSLGALAISSESPDLSRQGNYVVRVIGVWFRFVSDFARLLMVGMEKSRTSLSYSRIAGVLKGAMIALPILLLFGGLMASADPAFSQAIVRCFQLDPVDVCECLFTFALVTPLVGGMVSRLALPPLSEAQSTSPKVANGTTGSATRIIGSLEILTAVTLVDILFLAFVLVQIRYFFGGSGRVASVAGLTFAEYARNGFFELTAIAALTIPLILGAKTLISSSSQRWFSVASGILLGCVTLILASAMERMRLYVSVFGLTELRLYTGFFMIWLATAIGWAGWVVLSSQNRTFLRNALVAGYAVVAALNVANPDALIASKNLTLGKKTDLTYLSNLSVDAAPVVAADMPRLSLTDQQTLRAQLLRNWKSSADALDWRSTNYSRAMFESQIKRRLFADPRS